MPILYPRSVPVPQLDRIGPYAVISFDCQPHRQPRHFRMISRPGLDGLTIFDLGYRGEPFTTRARLAAPTFAMAQEMYRNASWLEDEPPLPLCFGGLLEPGLLYKVLRARPVPGRVRAVVFGRGPLGNYRAWCEVDLTLVPVDAP
jgi:hypothetical protein